MRVKKALLTGAAAILISGCASRSVGVSPSSSPLRPGTIGTIPASGSSCQYALLGILPFGRTRSTQRALEEALESAEVTALTNVTIDETVHYFILFSRSCVYVEGLGVR